MAKEGIYFFLPFLAITAFFFFLFDQKPAMAYIYWALTFFFIGDLVLLFFRDPARKTPSGDNLIVSPADGTVMAVERTDKYNYVSIFMSVFNVHINRVPVSGKVTRLDYKPGQFKAAFKHDAGDVNERYEIEIASAKGKVLMYQIAGVIARRVVCRLKNGQDVAIGQRLGLIRFGSRVDLFLPLDVEIDIAKGQKVKGAETIIGRFV